MKKITLGILVTGVCLLTACNNANIGIIGGADGPTSIFIGENNTPAYIPDGMEIGTTNDNEKYSNELIFNRKPENVTIEVLADTVSSKGVTLVITDNNEDSYGWGKSYKLQKKENEQWKELKPIAEMIFEEIAYVLDDNNQYTQKIDWKKFYGELEKGTYRIVKDCYDNGYIYFYSNEFNI